MKPAERVLVAVAGVALVFGATGLLMGANAAAMIGILVSLAVLLTLCILALVEVRTTARKVTHQIERAVHGNDERTVRLEDALSRVESGIQASQALVTLSLDSIPGRIREQFDAVEKESQVRAKKVVALVDALQKQVARIEEDAASILRICAQIDAAGDRSDKDLRQLLSDQQDSSRGLRSLVVEQEEQFRRLLVEKTGDLVSTSDLRDAIERRDRIDQALMQLMADQSVLSRALAAVVIGQEEESRRLLKEVTSDLASTSEMKNTLERLESTLLDETKRSQQLTLNRAVVAMQEETQQVEALLQLHVNQAHEWPLPSLGRWALDARSALHLRAIIVHKKPKVIVELGSGTSTIWLGHLCREIGATLVSIEHLESYLVKTKEQVELHGLSDVVDLRLGELTEQEVEGERYRWYSPRAFDDLEPIDVLLVDGPPSATGRLARYPAIPLLATRLKLGACVLLDDCDRPDEIEAVKRWQELFPWFTRHHESVSRLALLEDARGA